MNILYLSVLNGDYWAGPTYSVPKQIESQCKYDNVFWYNLYNHDIKDWKKLTYYHDLTEYPKGTIANLPSPFNKPELIIVEQFYGYGLKRIVFELMRLDVPYIIIPRGELTTSAQQRKYFKKLIANTFLFRTFAQKASSIEFLTEQERIDSGIGWNNSSIVVPNGIVTPKETKHFIKNKDNLRFVFVGRIEPYHKGIDLLINACTEIRDELTMNNCIIDIYGPDYDNKANSIKSEINEKGLSNTIFVHDGIYGNEKKDILLNSDVFVLTSRFEGHPMALIEALSFGLPCLITKGTNMSDYVEEYNAGWTATNDSQSIKKAILKLLDEKNELATKGNNALTLSKLYNWDYVADKSHTLYETIVRSFYE